MVCLMVTLLWTYGMSVSGEDASCSASGGSCTVSAPSMVQMKSKRAQNHVKVQASALGGVNSTGAPRQDCDNFALACGMTTEVFATFSDWSEMQTGFITCCMAGNHEPATCASIGTEVFQRHDLGAPLADGPTEQFCKEIEDLRRTHFSWRADQLAADRSGLLQLTSVPALANRMAEYLLGTEATAPDFVPALLSKLAFGAAATTTLLVQTTSKSAQLAIVASALSTSLMSCGCIGTVCDDGKVVANCRGPRDPTAEEIAEQAEEGFISPWSGDSEEDQENREKCCTLWPVC